MDHHIGFAFSVEQISYAVFESPDMVLADIGSLPYPFEYEESHFLEQEARISLTSVLKNILQEKNLKAKSLSFSIESNLAFLRRVVYPENLEESGVNDHIAWHLTESLNLPLKEYVYIRSDNLAHLDGMNEELIVSIQKKLVGFFREIARDLEIPLRNLTVHHLAAEIALNAALPGQKERLIILFKIAPSRLETVFFLDSRLYKSHLERIHPLPGAEEYQLNLINMIKQQIAYIENLFQATRQTQIPVDRLLIYGPRLENNLLSLIQKNMSIPVHRFNPLQNIEISANLQPVINEETASKYVECIGVSLDQ
jgi:Tfp pilus assembly PilM family ATPase